MTVNEAINKIDALVPNVFSFNDKLMWLSTLDGMIKENILSNYIGCDDTTRTDYTEDDGDTPLVVSAPYDTIYLYWLQAQINYWNQEIIQYQNSMDMYNTALAEFKNYYNRKHTPKKNKFKFF